MYPNPVVRPFSPYCNLQFHAQRIMEYEKVNQISEFYELPATATPSERSTRPTTNPPSPRAVDPEKGESESSSTSRGKKVECNAYRKRNVYKAIIRRMFSYIQKERNTAIEILAKIGFSMDDINSAFLYIHHLNDLDKQKGKSKRPQNTINVILKGRNTCAYILKETLRLMIEGWKTGDRGKIMKGNVGIYKEVCESYYSKCQKLLSCSVCMLLFTSLFFVSFVP
eukprot:TRINITY_DN3057_c0_g1_i7.p1 TRINITY_DN3057_c0_g1~~TRINITY_DN3057_c0_g1_i7.p1  ORF type:complete len:225 (-),score=9.88 TRINITY_DN3057_c0_g1_i7:30-704(-)